jgi:hypothetical protein
VLTKLEIDQVKKKFIKSEIIERGATISKGNKGGDEHRKCVSSNPKALGQGRTLSVNTYIILLVRAV